MKKGLKIFVKILETIVVIPCGIAGAILLTPFVILGLIFAIPACILEDIWEVEIFPDTDVNEEEK